MSSLKNCLIILILFGLSINLSAQSGKTITIEKALAVKTINPFERNIFGTDRVEYLVVSGKWKVPLAGDKITVTDSVNVWKTIKVNKNGWFEDSSLEGGYAYAEIKSEKNETALLDGMGYNLVYVNGSPRMGNKYQSSEKQYNSRGYGFSVLPVEIKKGKNTFLFRCTRGRFKARIYFTGEKIFFNTNDLTLPDLLTGETPDYWGAAVVVNATHKPIKNYFISAKGPFEISSQTKIPVIEPMSIRKVGFKINGTSPNEKGKIKIHLMLSDGKDKIYDNAEINLRVVDASDNHKITFISGIDGSVQYYSINPASKNDGKPKALFLSLHGASVEAVNQSGSYFPKSWGHIVSPTNRRPYGFDWEDWGRMDAVEVYNLALKSLNIDLNRIYLTGHSMGGHGTWQLGALYPDKFGAIGPSAGWPSFWTYGIIPEVKNPSAMQSMVMRAYLPVNTFAMENNYKQEGIYIIHGIDDDNVPIAQAEEMVKHLKPFHRDFVLHKQPNANHWWDVSDEPGADCVDWAPLFDFFARHARPLNSQILTIDFETPSPGISSKDYWVSIEAQTKLLKISKVHFLLDPGLNRITGTTENVARLAFDSNVINKDSSVIIIIDGQKLNNISVNKDQNKIWLEKLSGVWKLAEQPSPDVKNPARYGLLKDAFKNRMIFVYGTGGTNEENKWAFDKARFDAEQFWYQGNGSVDILPDTEFDPSSEPGRNVIIYGNEKTNSAWDKVLGNCPVTVAEGKVTIGDKEYSGGDLGILFIYPRKGSDLASVGVVAGSGIEGMKLNDVRPYLYSGFEFPDLMMYSEKYPGSGADGILAAGFFGNDWTVKNGEFVFK